MKFLLFQILCFISFSAFSQKTVEKIIASEGISKIEINSDEIFKVSIKSTAVEAITINSKFQGEHYKDLVVTTSVENGILSIKTAYSPFFIADNDKLAAHKLISVEVTLEVPQNLAIQINSQIASVFASGIFTNFEVGLENGNCQLTDFLGNASLKTKNGFINVTAKSDVNGRATSKHGEVKNNLPKIGKYLIVAESITGSISLQEMK